MLSAASVSAFSFSAVIASTGMLIWGLVGLTGMLTGLITVGTARRRNRPAESSPEEATAGTESQPATAAPNTAVSPQSLTQAA